MAKSDALVQEIAAAVAGDKSEAAQLDFLMPPTRTTMTDHELARVEEAARRFEKGRPPGAKNIATREMLEFVRKMMGDPLERRARYAMHTPESLSIELGCTKLEAFDRLDRIWSELARYFYAQQAQVDGKGNAVVPWLTMQFGGQGAAVAMPDGSVEPPWITHLRTINAAPEKDEQNQASLPSPDGVSHGSVSHDD